MIQNLFVLNSRGDVFIEKHYRGVMARTICETFWQFVTKAQTPADVNPVISTPKCYLIHIQRNRLFFLAVVQLETPPLLVLEFLNRVGEVFVDYFGELTEEKLREHFSLVACILDEMNDNGFPFTTEPNVLKEMIAPPSVLGQLGQIFLDDHSGEQKLPEGATSNIQWRKMGVKYTNNEIYLDLIESVDTIVDSSSLIISQEISGEIQVNSRLSGMPDLTLTFTDPSVLDDVSFHPCVRYSRYERDRVLSFVPPDGVFNLAKYRCNQQADLPLYVKPQFSWHGSTGKIMVMCGTKNTRGKDVEDVVVTIPFPKCVATVSFSVNCGSVHYDEMSRTCRWNIGTLPKHITPQLNGNITLGPSEVAPDSNPTLSVDFKLQMVTLSGLKVGSLVLTNERYKPFKGVRSLTKAGNIQIRA
jgi:AP-3 complex subunit mu